MRIGVLALSRIHARMAPLATTQKAPTDILAHANPALKEQTARMTFVLAQ